MNNNLIITHKDGRTWNEGQLESLYKTFDEEMGDDDNISLCSATGPNGTDWYICNDDYDASYPLDPSLYTVSPVGMIAVEKARECIEEIKRIMPAGFLEVGIDTIASKYIGEEN